MYHFTVASFHRLHYNFSFARGESLGTRLSLLYRTDSYRQAETGYGTLTVKSCSGGNRGSPFSQWGPQFTRKMGTRENGGRSPFSRGSPKFYATGIATDNYSWYLACKHTMVHGKARRGVSIRSVRPKVFNRIMHGAARAEEINCTGQSPPYFKLS